MTKRLTVKQKNGKPSPVRAREGRNPQPSGAQLEALKAWHKLLGELGRDPTIRELSAELGLSTNGASDHVAQLVVKGLLQEHTRPVVESRSLTDLGKRWLKTMA